MAVRTREFGRHFRAAAWLGWQIESNWADPFLFAVYSLAKPLATALILTAIYRVVAGGTTGEARFAWMYVGNAFYVFVPLGLVGVAYTVVDDRENFQVLKYVYVSPVGLFTYLAGRALTKFVLASLSAAVLLAVGGLFLGVRYHTDPGHALYGLVAIGFGVLGVFGLALLLAGAALVFARHSVNLNEGVAAVLYLLCGAIFPIDLLPAVVRAAGLTLPLTWWLEAMRRAWLGVPASGVLGRAGDFLVLGLLVLTSLAWYAAGAGIYLRLERRAKQLGLIDQTTSF
jgi:ABC-2 type transport system permease protein